MIESSNGISVSMSGSLEGKLLLDNTGIIRETGPGSTAIYGYRGLTQTVLNRGAIYGDVDFHETDTGKVTFNSGTGDFFGNYYGGGGRDVVFGGRQSEYFDGRKGDDLLRGCAGADTLFGGDGADKIYGGSGSDKMYGGAGKDTFGFAEAPQSFDTIVDFQPNSDKITLSNSHFDVGSEGALTSSAFYLGTAAHRIIYHQPTGSLFYDPDGVGGVAAIKFAMLENRIIGLSAADFIIT